MSGPPYPPLPGPGANAIGKFIIGVSPVGDIAPTFNYWTTVVSQYANSPVITALIGYSSAWYDQTANFDSFFDNIMNVDTALGYGLDVWGRIVGLKRTLTVVTSSWFGFAEARPGSLEFNQGAFYSGGALTSNFTLADQTYRKLILAKAQFNITQGSIQAINQILINLFPNRGNAFVTEGQAPQFFFGFAEAQPGSLEFNQGVFYSGQITSRMVMTYTFNFPLSPLEYGIVAYSGVLPKPTGVMSGIVTH